MSTPSNSSDLPGTPASELLNDDGTVDVSAVRSRASAASANTTHIDVALCGRVRRVLAETRNAGETAAECGVGKTAARRHAKGECHHSDAEVDAPTLSFERDTGWVVDA